MRASYTILVENLLFSFIGGLVGTFKFSFLIKVESKTSLACVSYGNYGSNRYQALSNLILKSLPMLIVVIEFIGNGVYPFYPLVELGVSGG